MARRTKEPGAAEEEKDRESVTVKIPIPDRSRRSAMILQDGGVEGEPDKRHTKQGNPDITQTAIRDGAEEPEQSEAFESPAQRDPFALELNRKNEADEKERRAGLPGKTCVSGGGIRAFALY